MNCRHCGEPIVTDGGGGWLHTEGDHQRFYSCSKRFGVSPNAEPMSISDVLAELREIEGDLL